MGNKFNNEIVLKLDNSISSVEGRKEIVEQIIEQSNGNISKRYMEILTDYILFAERDKKDKTILTRNREKTINKRETSFESLQDNQDKDEDWIYSIITNDKNVIFKSKITITNEDLKTIPGLKELHEAILEVQTEYESAVGKRKFLLRKQIIEMCKQQYSMKNSYRRPIFIIKKTRQSLNNIDLSEEVYMTADGEIESTGKISMVYPDHVFFLLKNYDKIKKEYNASFDTDLKWAINDLDNLIKETFNDFPMYKDIVRMKISGYQNVEIQEYIRKNYGAKHSLEYISSLWRHKIPRMISDTEKNGWLVWYYKKYGKESDWKKCTRCKEIKPKHNNFFSRNKTSKDGFYSICKCCRNKK